MWSAALCTKLRGSLVAIKGLIEARRADGWVFAFLGGQPAGTGTRRLKAPPKCGAKCPVHRWRTAAKNDSPG
jgi:hypothetical protein